MNFSPVQSTLDQLLDHLLRNPSTDKKARLMSLCTRILSSNFGEELQNSNQLEIQLAKQSGGQNTRVLELLTNFRNKKFIINKENVIRCLLKLSETQQRSSAIFNTRGFNSSDMRSTQFTERPNNIYSSRRIDDKQFIQEEPGQYNALFKSVICTLQALQTEYFIYDKNLEMFVVKPKYEDILSLSVMKFFCNINEIGWLYLRLINYFDTLQGKVLALTLQSCVTAVKEELDTFYKFLSMLDDFQKTKNFTSTSFVTSLQIFYEDTFEKLRNLAIIIDYGVHLKSAELLSMLFLTSKNEFIERKAYISTIFKKSSRSLLEFLNSWICKGEILDPMGEFFIKVNPDCKEKEQQWRLGLIFYKSKVPCFIDDSSSQIIFTVGKVIRLLKKVDRNFMVTGVEPISLDELVSQTSNLDLHTKLQKVYIDKNRDLLNFLLSEHNLMEILEFWRGTMFTTRGDLTKAFISSLDNEIGLHSLHKSLKHQLIYALDNAIRDTIKESKIMMRGLSFIYMDTGAYQQVDLNSPTLYLVNFTFNAEGYDAPLNYFFTKENVTVYQSCFRYIFTIRVEHHELVKLWRVHSQTKLDKNPHIKTLLKLASAIRVKMLNFVETIMSYWLYDCIDSEWKIMLSKLRSANGLDDYLNAHDSYLANLYKKVCFVERGNQHEETQRKERYDLLLGQIVELVRRFRDLHNDIFDDLKKELNMFEEGSIDSIEKLENAEYNNIMELSANASIGLQKTMKEIDGKFVKCVIDLIEFINEPALFIKLDFNQYYAVNRRIIDNKLGGSFY